MVLVNRTGRETNAKVVYYGPGLSGKTTSLEFIYNSIPQAQRGKLITLRTKTERTLFFDFLVPVEIGELAGSVTRFLVYAMPGQACGNATMDYVLKDVDAIVFVADSARGKMVENLEHLQKLDANLRERGLSLAVIPWVLQYNKRDLPDVYTVGELNEALNPDQAPCFETVATSGQGVLEAFKRISRLLLQKLFYEAEAHAKLGLVLFGQKRPGDARRELEAALGRGYRSPDLHFALARILEAEAEAAGLLAGEAGTKEAEFHCRAALAIDDAYLEARALLSVVLWREGRPAESLEELRRLSGQEFHLPEGLDLDRVDHLDEHFVREVREEIFRRQESQEHLKQALDAYDRGDRDLAIEEMRMAVAQNPVYADLRCKLGVLYLEAGTLELAETELVEALRINPNYVEARLQLGLLLLRQDRPEHAAVHFDLAARLQPRYPDVLLCQGVAHLRQGRFPEARTHIEEALQLHPRFHRARYFLALTLTGLGQTAAALSQMEKVLEEEPNFSRAQCDLGYLYLRSGAVERARAIFHSLIGSNPDHSDARLGMGLALLESHQPGEACEHLLRAATLSPNFGRAHEELARLQIGAGDYDEAEALLRVSVDPETSTSDHLYLLGRSLEGQGKDDEAIVCYERALHRNPSSMDAHLALGLALFRRGDGAWGRREMGAVLRADPGHPLARAVADPRVLEEL